MGDFLGAVSGTDNVNPPWWAFVLGGALILYFVVRNARL